MPYSLILTGRDPSKPWIFMTYESATNVRQRSSNWGRYPPINWHKINHVFNRTMTFRKDSDVTVRYTPANVVVGFYEFCFYRHGYFEKRSTPLTDSEMATLYSQVGSGFRQRNELKRYVQVPFADFSHYTYPYFKSSGNTSSSSAPIAWFVSHCNAHSGRWAYIQLL